MEEIKTETKRRLPYTMLQYNIDLLTYLISINTDFKNTINDPEMQQIKEKIMKEMNIENICLYDNRYRQKVRLESERLKLKPILRKEIVEIKPMKLVKKRKKDDSKYKNDIIMNSEDKDNIIMDSEDENYNTITQQTYQKKYLIEDKLEGGDELYILKSNFKDIYKSNLRNEKFDINNDFEVIKNYVQKTQYHNIQNKRNIGIAGHELTINLCQDLSHIVLDIPTLKPDDIYYQRSFLWLVFYIISFNSKYLKEDIYRSFRCNYGYLPTYNIKNKINGNCLFTSILCYLYLLDSSILINLVINELHRIKNFIINENSTKEQIELFTECENEIFKLKLPLLNMLVLVILNCGNYNVYNTANDITYDQFNNQINFYRIKPEEYNRILIDLKNTDISTKTSIFKINEEVNKIKNFNNYLKFYQFTYDYDEPKQINKPITFKHQLTLREIINISETKQISHKIKQQYNFIYDSPFVLVLTYSNSIQHAVVLKPIGNGYVQLINPNFRCIYFEPQIEFYTKPDEYKCLFNLESDPSSFGKNIILTLDENTINDYFARSFGFDPKTTSVIDIWKKMRTNGRKSMLFLTPILSTYKSTYANHIIDNSCKECKLFSCKLNIRDQQNKIKFINYLFVVSTNNKIYQYKEKKLEKIEISDFYHEITYDQNQTFKILFNESTNRYYLYIGDYMWLNINQTDDVIHIENIDSELMIDKVSIENESYNHNEHYLFYLKNSNISEILDKYKDECREYLLGEVRRDIYKQIEQKEGSIFKGAFRNMNSIMASICGFLTKYLKQIILLLIILLIIIIIISVSIKYRTDK